MLCAAQHEIHQARYSAYVVTSGTSSRIPDVSNGNQVLASCPHRLRIAATAFTAQRGFQNFVNLGTAELRYAAISCSNRSCHSHQTHVFEFPVSKSIEPALSQLELGAGLAHFASRNVRDRRAS